MISFYDLKNTRGTYVLLIEVFQGISINLSSQQWILSPGYYLYFGSAKGNNSTSLGNRLKRHFDYHKKKFWHIDYITSHQSGKIVKAYYKTDQQVTECMNLNEFSSKHPVYKIKEMEIVETNVEVILFIFKKTRTYFLI
ncbi:MAG: DUF123 domain-containing protein [Candidatus Hodarchaeales archaeon]|jgi:Uri superfamily endonuclease